MNPSRKIDEQTKKEWNSLGFHYSRDDKNLNWVITGSKNGIMKFCNILELYSKDENNISISEHTHYGPYSYLKLVTWHKPKIAKREFYGRLSDFQNLSTIIKVKLRDFNGDFIIDKEFSDKNEYTIKFVIKEDGFEPASLDASLQYLSVQKLSDKKIN